MYIFCFSMFIITIQLLFIETLRYMYFTTCRCYLTLLFTVLSTISLPLKKFLITSTFWLFFGDFYLNWPIKIWVLPTPAPEMLNSEIHYLLWWEFVKVSTHKCLKLTALCHSLIYQKGCQKDVKKLSHSMPTQWGGKIKTCSPWNCCNVIQVTYSCSYAVVQPNCQVLYGMMSCTAKN